MTSGTGRQHEDDTELEIDVELDPVCGALVDLDEADARGMAIEYEGREYVFCGEVCRERFERGPVRYAAAGRAAP